MLISRFLFILFLCSLPFQIGSWSIPLPGGVVNIKVEDGGIIRIQRQNDPSLLVSVPPNGTPANITTLQSIEIRDTKTSKGYGAFCVQPLNKHAFLGFYEGDVVLSRYELEQRDDGGMDYAMSMDGGSTFVDGYSRAQDRDNFSPVHLNHADRGSLGCNCFRVLESRNVAFFTSRNIEVGEELCFDYGPDYWKGRENEKI